MRIAIITMLGLGLLAGGCAEPTTAERAQGVVEAVRVEVEGLLLPLTGEFGEVRDGDLPGLCEKAESANDAAFAAGAIITDGLGRLEFLEGKTRREVEGRMEYLNEARVAAAMLLEHHAVLRALQDRVLRDAARCGTGSWPRLRVPMLWWESYFDYYDRRRAQGG